MDRSAMTSRRDGLPFFIFSKGDEGEVQKKTTHKRSWFFFWILFCYDTHLQPEAVAVDLGDLRPPGDIIPRVFLGVLIVARLGRGLVRSRSSKWRGQSINLTSSRLIQPRLVVRSRTEKKCEKNYKRKSDQRQRGGETIQNSSIFNILCFILVELYHFEVQHEQK